MKLYNIISTLILEQVSNNEIIDAIKNKHVCEMEYEDDSSIGPGKRTVEPVASGPSLKVNEEGIPLPDWRLFRVDRMSNFKPIQGEGSVFETFPEPPLYNPMGDKSMSRMLVNSKF